MAHQLMPLIEYVEKSGFSHVVVYMGDPRGIRLKAETEAACKVMADIMGEQAKAMPKEEFQRKMRKIVEEDDARAIAEGH